MCSVELAGLALTAVLGAGSASEQQKAGYGQRVGRDQSLASAKKAADQADQQNNKINARQADFSQSDAEMGALAKGGVAGTMLTGPSGIDQSTLTLGRKTLLGG